jgi:hypothetical protein
MDRQTLRDWVIRFNEQGPDDLVNIPSPGAPPKLNDTHKAFLAGIVHEGQIPAIHGVVRWRFRRKYSGQSRNLSCVIPRLMLSSGRGSPVNEARACLRSSLCFVSLER